jgi:hypothetical protein
VLDLGEPGGGKTRRFGHGFRVVPHFAGAKTLSGLYETRSIHAQARARLELGFTPGKEKRRRTCGNPAKT